MSAPEKEDHVVAGLASLNGYWLDKPNVVNLLKSYLQAFNTVEDMMFDLLENRGIYDAMGVQIDILGALFNVKRGGRNDEDYRSAILTKISQLSDDGTTEKFMQTLRNISNGDLVDFWEHPSGDVHAYFGSGLISSKTYSQIENAVPAGVNVVVMVDDMGDSFVPIELIPSAPDLQVDDGITISDLQVDDSLLVSDLQVQLLNLGSTPHGYLPEIEDTDLINPLAEIINKDFYPLVGNLVFENDDFMVDADGNALLWTDYTFDN